MGLLRRRPRPVLGRGVRVSALAGLVVALLALCPPCVAPVRAQGTLSAFEADVDRIAKRARPCMVTVIAQRDVAARPGAPKRAHSRVGSGAAVSAHEVLTTATVVLGASRVYVVTDNKLEVEARVIGLDPVRNLALLGTQGLELPSLPLSAEPGESGDWVIALGSSYRSAPTQSVGTVAMRFAEPGTSLLQLTNEVYPGNSGGAALNSRGELLGLVQGELGSPSAPGNRERAERRPGGMSFAIPVEDIVPFLDGLARFGRVRHGMLGVSTRSVFVNGAGGPSDRVPIGALVETVAPNGPAARLGLRKGDLIVAFNGEKVEYSEQLARWVAVAGPAAEVKLVWVRDELGREGRVRLDEAPSAIPSWMRVDAPAAVGVNGATTAPTAFEARTSRTVRGVRDSAERVTR